MSVLLGRLASSSSRSGVVLALTALAPMVWGTTYIVTSELLPPDRPLLSGALRALPAGLLVIGLTRILPRGHWWWRAALLGTLNIGAFFALLFLAAYRLPGGVAATLGSVQPLLVAGLAFLVLGERTTAWKLAWSLVGILGIALMVLKGTLVLDPVGIAAGLGGAAAMASGVVLGKRWGRPVPLMTFTGWQLTAGGLLLAPLAWWLEGPPPAIDAAALLGYVWLALPGTLIAYALWFRGIERLPATSLSFLPLLSPTVATLVGWGVLGEALTPPQLLGFLLVLAAIAAAQLSPRARRGVAACGEPR
ncbi:EamA family transporter [Halomonas organivorans]|uniref:Putative blue pigment (Indigoidine) exporter n=1 Tax=Halomonas organivorans TaxID=257772 RepID=A0A7W5BVA2_9GAMM|nr:EamA family transporter [Halomonas organivorans]MBB3139795.1 putative blue pigment (indigoidine) exporter [Halomonas organivorans]